MRFTKKHLFFLLIFTCLYSKAFADGKMYKYKEEIPANIPYQRACIFFYEGQQTLVLQSKYEISELESVESLGWIVPAPSVPEIASMQTSDADDFFMYASFYTRPNIFRRSVFIKEIIFFTLLSIFVICFISSLALAVFFPFLNRIGLTRQKFWMLEKVSLITLGISAFILICIVRTLVSSAGIPYGIDYVEVIKAEQVGIYDVKVIRSDSTDAILAWLQENEFGFNENDTKVFDDYINRDWCFVTAKIDPQPDTEVREMEIATEGLAAPLILKFDAEKAVYPMALTSTIGINTEVLLYTMSDKKLSCSEYLPLLYADIEVSYNLTRLFHKEEVKQEIIDFLDGLPDDMILCKFKGTLTPQQMEQDIVFEHASDNEPYRETKVVW